VFDDLVTELFTADAPNWLWLTDLREHWGAEGKLYCCMITDARSHQIVDYSLNSTRQRTRASSLTRSSTPVQRRGDLLDCILHTDHGSQLRSPTLTRALGRHEVVGSMGPVASASDNTTMESFWSLLQKSVLDQQHRWATRQDLRLAIVT